MRLTGRKYSGDGNHRPKGIHLIVANRVVFRTKLLMTYPASADSLHVSSKSRWSRVMATTKDIRHLAPSRPASLPASERRGQMGNQTDKRAVGTSSVRLAPGVLDFKDRRRRRRINLLPMYTFASLRVLSRCDGPLEGHVINLSETGMVVEIDNMVPVGQPVTVEFCVSGLGRLRGDQWPTYAVAAEVVRIDDVAEFPQGPYRTALRFVRIPTMAQAQIARYIATRSEKTAV
jgi:hypothetical protein